MGTSAALRARIWPSTTRETGWSAAADLDACITGSKMNAQQDQGDQGAPSNVLTTGSGW